MAETTILQHWIVSKFILPFLLVFFVIFAILQKTKLFGDGKKQLDALVAFVISLIFVGAMSSELVISNLILFLTISIVIVLVVLMLWGFVAGEEGLKFSNAPSGLKWVIGIVIVVAVFFAVLWATGLKTDFVETLFRQNWSNTFWTSVSFIVVIAIALAVVLKSSGGK